MNTVAGEMKHLHKLARENPDKRFSHLWEDITDPKWLVYAWEEIKHNKGSQTPGIDGQTALNVDVALISQWARELKTGTYRPLPVRRVYIPKSNGKTRPLGIPTIKDRTIQQGLKMLLEPIFEADFRNCSHGFRQGRSTFTALRNIARTYPATIRHRFTMEEPLGVHQRAKRNYCFPLSQVGQRTRLQVDAAGR
jgi:RNA-directed DNA polymerase